MAITRRGALAGGLTLLLAAGLAACSSSPGTTPGGDGTTGTEALTLGVIPVTDIGPVYMGQQNGVFTSHGLDVTLQSQASSADIITGMISGQIQVGYGGATAVYQAVENGTADLVIIAAASSTPEDPDNGINDLLVTADSPLKSAKDLEGKKVAVNAPGGYTQLLSDIAVADAGGDPKKVQYVQMGVPDQPAALKSGAIDAFVAGEPFGTTAREQDGDKTLANPFTALSDHAIVAGVWYALRSSVEANPDFYKKVKAAIEEANTYALNHDAELRENIAAFTKIDPALAAKIRLGTYGKYPATKENLQPLADWTYKLGYMPQPLDTSTLIWQP